MLLGKEEKRTYPATFKIAEENFSLFVHLNIEGAWGRSAPPDLCSFYDEFGKLMKRSSPSEKSQTIVPSPQKPQEEQKACSSPPPPPPSPLPSPSPPQPIAAPTPSPPALSPAAPVSTPISVSPPSLSRGAVIWVEVNLRDGPSLQSKIVGKAPKGSTLEIYEEKKGWLRVRLENGKDGWVSRRAVSGTSKTPSSPSRPIPPVGPLKPPEPLRLPGPM